MVVVVVVGLIEGTRPMPSNGRHGRTLDGIRRAIPSRPPSVWLMNQMLNGTGTGP